MRFTPVFTSLLPEGEYLCTLAESYDHVNKQKGTESIYVKFVYVDANNAVTYLEDYLSGHPSFIHKLRHLCEALGLEEHYKKGEVTGSDINSRATQTIVLILKHGKDQNGKEKNSIVDYARVSSGSSIDDNKPPFNDEIPF